MIKSKFSAEIFGVAGLLNGDIGRRGESFEVTGLLREIGLKDLRIYLSR
jgi:hypothetical protein